MELVKEFYRRYKAIIKIVLVLYLLIMFISVVSADILIYENFEDGTDDTFPDRWTQSGTGNVWES